MTSPAADDPELGLLSVSEPGVYDAMPIDVYLADPTEGSLSVSGARKLLRPFCPAIYRWERDHPVQKAVFDEGRAAHQLVLGDVADLVTVIDATDYKTKAAQQARDEAREAGRAPVLIGRYAELEAMAEAIRRHPLAGRLLSPGAGRPEQSMFWRDPEAGIWRRGRLDWLPNPGPGRLILPDYKTCRSADPETFAKSAADYGYHQQAAWYLDGVQALGLDAEPAFVFVAQEKTPPYLVTVIELNETALNIGRILNRWAIQVFADCTRSGRWPGYSDDVELVSLPDWYERRHGEDPS